MKKLVSILKDLNPFSRREVDNKLIYTLKIIITVGVLYFVSLLIGEALIIGGSYAFGYNATDKPMPYDIMLLCSFYGYIITIALFVIFSKKVNKISLDKIGLDKNLKTFFKGMLIGIISLALIAGILSLCGAISFGGINNNINWLFFVLYLFGYLIQSTMEELVCRGYLFHRLKEKIPVIGAILISVLLFSVGHFSKLFSDGAAIGLIGIVNLMLISMIWIITTMKDKNIYSAIVFHFIWNFALFSIVGLNLSGLEATNAIFKFSANNQFLTGCSYGIESSIVTTGVLSIILAVLAFKYRVKNKKD